MNKLPIASKRLGQNWLVNLGVIDRIVAETAADADSTIVEVGPGTGVVTAQLARTGARIIAVEKDRHLIEPLKAALASYPNVTIVEGDILEFRPEDFGLVEGMWKLVGNIPYYLTSHLIRIALEEWHPSLVIMMVQEEVAKRMLARPPEMNLLALGVQVYARPSLVMHVSRGSFRPMPEVDSAVVRLDRRTDERKGDPTRALELARAAFAHKRKQLSSSIPAETLIAAGIAPTARPQELNTDDWLRLSTPGTSE
jgi:16S rRNA (adenine1518-N6/adenine1519-N6)-dimethyltransferase